MYRYDEFDQKIVDERVTQFRGQVARRLSGELTEDQFKPLRLMNGLYLQLHAYMLRVAIPYGTLDGKQMRKNFKERKDAPKPPESVVVRPGAAQASQPRTCGAAEGSVSAGISAMMGCVSGMASIDRAWLWFHASP